MKIQQKWKPINVFSLLVQSAIHCLMLQVAGYFLTYSMFLSFSCDLKQGLICAFVSSWVSLEDRLSFRELLRCKHTTHCVFRCVSFCLSQQDSIVTKRLSADRCCYLYSCSKCQASMSVPLHISWFFVIALLKVIMIWFGWKCFWSPTCVVILRRVEIHVFFFQKTE